MIPFLFVLIPFTELMILLSVGNEIGALPTLGIIILTASIGYTLFRRQGMATWQKLQLKLSEGQMPSEEILDGIVILIAGALMITPGLITDFIGFFCLIPLSRKFVLTYLKRMVLSKVSIVQHTSNQNPSEGHSKPNVTIEGEYTNSDKK